MSKYDIPSTHRPVCELLMVVRYRRDVLVYNLFVDKQFHFDQAVEAKWIFQKNKFFFELIRDIRNCLLTNLMPSWTIFKIQNNATTIKN